MLDAGHASEKMQGMFRHDHFHRAISTDHHQLGRRPSTCHSRDEIDRRVIRPGQVLENQQQRIFSPIFLFSVITLFGVTLNGVNLF